METQEQVIEAPEEDVERIAKIAPVLMSVLQGMEKAHQADYVLLEFIVGAGERAYNVRIKEICLTSRHSGSIQRR